jgi:hypothetical protein
MPRNRGGQIGHVDSEGDAKMKPSSRPRYFYGALAFIGVVVVVFASLIALQRMLGTISYAP